jgi:hypothetical protein
LEYSFRKRKAMKDMKLYTNLTLIYETYPDIIKKILDSIPELGYWKDYFYILSVTKNPTMESYIYNIIVKQLKLDLVSCNPSTLGKFLPREKSKLNKGFIDKFNKLFFPQTSNKIKARQLYRNLKTNLNKKLGTIESKLCTKEYDQIEYAKVAPYALKRHTKSLMNNEITKNKLEKYQLGVLKNKTLSEFVKEIVTNEKSFSPEIFEDVWQLNLFMDSIPYLNQMINATCLIDLSASTYNVGGEFLTIGIALLNGSQIVIGNHLTKLEGNIVCKTKQILKQIGPSTFKTENQDKLIIVTSQDLPDLKIYGLQVLHIKPNHETFNLTYYDGMETTLTNISHTISKKNNRSKIQDIICPNKKIVKPNGVFSSVYHFIMSSTLGKSICALFLPTLVFYAFRYFSVSNGIKYISELLKGVSRFII